MAFSIRLIFVVAFALHSNWINYSSLDGPHSMEAGVDGYVQIARTLLISGEYAFSPGGTPVSYRPPLVPFLMAAFGAWSADSWYRVWLAYSVVAGTFTIWILARCTQAVGMKELPSKILLLVVALHPYLIFSTRVPALPVTLTLLTTVILFFTIRFVKSGGTRFAGLGIWWGLASLTHGSFLPLLFPFLLTLLPVLDGPWLKRFLRIAVVAVIPLMIVAPWTFRNQIVFKKLIPVATGSGLQYWLGDSIYLRGDRNIPQAFDRVIRDFKTNEGRKLSIVHGGILELEDDAVLAARAKQQIKTEPLIIFKRIAIGLPLFWITMDGGWKKALIVSALNLPLLLLYLLASGYAIYKKAWTPTWIACQFFFLGYWSLFALIQAVGPYFVSITPYFLFLSLLGWSIASSAGKPQDRRNTPA